MSKIEKECQCCGMIYVVRFVQQEEEQSDNWDPQEETFEEKEEIYPEYCPFCGSHDDDEPLEDE